MQLSDPLRGWRGSGAVPDELRRTMDARDLARAPELSRLLQGMVDFAIGEKDPDSVDPMKRSASTGSVSASPRSGAGGGSAEDLKTLGDLLLTRPDAVTRCGLPLG